MDRFYYGVLLYTVCFHYYRSRVAFWLDQHARALRAIGFASVTVLSLIGPHAVAWIDLELAKRVDNNAPAPGSPVEFTIEVNSRGTETATGVAVVDLLPPTMEVPTGLAVYASQGFYDEATGLWSVGDLMADGAASLVIPAIVKEEFTTGCIVNSASVAHRTGEDNDPADNQAIAVLYLDGEQSCHDLRVTVSAALGHQSPCYGLQWVDVDVKIENLGPDPVTDVDLSLVLNEAGSSVHTYEERVVCQDDAAGIKCTRAELGAGEVMHLTFSHAFNHALTVEYAASVSGTATDGNGANDLASGTLQVAAVKAKKGECSTAGSIDLSGIDVGPIGPTACLIATAAYGSWIDPHVAVLRQLRDRHLMTNRPGRALVQFYYRTSPPIAEAISRHEALRALVRLILTPLVYLIAFPGRMATAAAMLVLLSLRVRRARRTHCTDP